MLQMSSAKKVRHEIQLCPYAFECPAMYLHQNPLPSRRCYVSAVRFADGAVVIVPYAQIQFLRAAAARFLRALVRFAYAVVFTSGPAGWQESYNANNSGFRVVGIKGTFA
jgi:hypothetical protein